MAFCGSLREGAKYYDKRPDAWNGAQDCVDLGSSGGFAVVATKCDSARAGPEDPFGPLAPRPANGHYGGISRSLGRKIEFQATARAVQIRLS